MGSGYILILAIIFLGGAIATVGDRIGTRVGKARLSLFNLRPRTTAIVVTILTGGIISASTVGILLATSKDLRDAVFRIGEIKRQLRASEAELERAKVQKQKTQKALAEVSQGLSQARTELQQVNRNLQAAIARQQQTQAKLNQLQASYLKAQRELQQFSQQSQTLKTEVARLAREQQQLQSDRDNLLSQRNQVQARLQAVNEQKQKLEAAVKLTQTQKQQLESAVRTASDQRTQLLQQQQRLQQEVASLEGTSKRLGENLEALLLRVRGGNITIRTGQVLAAGTFSNIKDKKTSLEMIGALLRQARRNAIVLANPERISPDQQVIQITERDVERLALQLQDGQPYVVRILSAANYLAGESQILVVPQVARNQAVLSPGERLATVTFNPGTMTDTQILNRLNELFTQSNRRAIQRGVLPDPVTGGVGEFNQIDLFKFVLDLKQSPGELEVTAIAHQTVYTAGPLRLELIATRNQRVILKTNGNSPG